MTIQQLKRTYIFTDTVGDMYHFDPLNRDDPDAIISHHIRGLSDQTILREFDLAGRASIVDHVLRTIVSLHHESNKSLGITGIVINKAPRTKLCENGQPFYLAELKNNIRIVTTPLGALSAIRDHVSHLFRIDEDNEVWPRGSQFRSSYVAALLSPYHTFHLLEEDVAIIPKQVETWHVSYIDRFGNIITHGCTDKVLVTLAQPRECILHLGNDQRQVKVISSLLEAQPGQLALYGNDGNIDVVYKWSNELSDEECFEESAYIQFQKPQIGTQVSIKL